MIGDLFCVFYYVVTGIWYGIRDIEINKSSCYTVRPAAKVFWEGIMGETKPTLQWAERTLRTLSEQKYTGTVIIRFAQGGVQGMAVNQELHPRQQTIIIEPEVNNFRA